MFVHFNIFTNLQSTKSYFGDDSPTQVPCQNSPGQHLSSTLRAHKLLQNEVLMWQMAKETPLAQATWLCQKKHPNGNGIGSISQSNKKKIEMICSLIVSTCSTFSTSKKKMVFGCDLYRFLRFFFGTKRNIQGKSLATTAPVKPVVPAFCVSDGDVFNPSTPAWSRRTGVHGP